MKLALIPASLILAVSMAVQAWSADPSPKTPARMAVEPVAPDLPAAIVAAMQDGKFDEADKALAALANDPKIVAADRPYLDSIRGAALRLSGKPDAARTVLATALRDTPKGRWTAKLRSELAAVEVASGKYAAAEAIARDEAETLLADGRKDRLAEVYRGFADRLLNPDSPAQPVDPEGAYALLIQARSLAKGEPVRASLLLAMARASVKAGNPARAITDYQLYLKDHPKGPDRDAARFGLAEAQLASGQPIPARLTWADLARELERSDTKDAADFRARSLFMIATTHGLPAPPDDAQLALGVAALQKMLAAYPSHPLAVRASYTIAASYLARGKSQEALAAFATFLKGDDAKADKESSRKERAELVMSAQFQVAQILQAQGKFDAAIDAFKGYLANHPDGPQSADAQRGILDVEFQAAYDSFRREKFADARASFLAFVARNPLDGRVPQLLFDVGMSSFREKKYDDAIAAWDTLAGKFPGTEAAGHAQFLIGSTLENEKRDLPAAIDRFRKVGVEPWASQARHRIALMEAKSLTVVTERVFRSGETPRLKVSTRNINKLTFNAYKLDPETYFRKKHCVTGIEGLDIGLVAPDAEWSEDVPKFAKYAPLEAEFLLKKLDLPGVYVVKVSDEKTLQATTMVIGSDLDAIVKTSRDQVLAFVQDMKTGKGRAGARVLVSDGQTVLLDAKTGDDGVLLKSWDKPRDPSSRVSYLVLDKGDVAGSTFAMSDKVAQGLSARAYLYTDRPAYRPGDEVHLRGVVREIVDGQYGNFTDATYWVEVYDPRGRKLVNHAFKLSEFGTFHENLDLDSAASVGTYRVRVTLPGKSEFAGTFEVQSYQLEKIDLAIDLPKTVYYRGQTIAGSVLAKYQYGTPIASRKVSVQLPDGRTLTGETDASGRFAFEMETTGFAEEQALQLVARLTEDNVAVAASVMLAVRAFRIDLSTIRDVYLDGESFLVNASTYDAQGEPIAQALRLSVLKKVARDGQVAEVEVSKQTLLTDKATGKAALRLKVEDDEGGQFVVRASGVDRFENVILAERALTISGKKDATKLRLLTDRGSFKVGETADVRLLNRGSAGTALLTWEADRVLQYRVVAVKEGETSVSWEVPGAQFPNFTLTASRMEPPAFHEARLDLRIERDLTVTITPKSAAVGPNQEVEAEVTAVDQNGKPVAAELSVALVDKSLLRLFADQLTPIDRFFHDQSRTSAFATESTATFRYAPATTPVPEAVVEEADRQSAMAADSIRMGEVSNEANLHIFAANGAAQATMAAAPSPMPADKPMAGSMGGGGSRAFGLELSAAAKDEKRDGGDSFREAGATELSKKGAEAKASGRAMGRKAKSASRRDLALRSKTTDRSGDDPSPRDRFVETAYWNPSVVTGKDGKATIKFRSPGALSEYKFTARGVSKSDTLVGQANADLAVRKEFFVDLKVPSSLTQGDKPRFAAEVHHKGVAAGSLKLRLSLYAGGREVVVPLNREVKVDGMDSFSFEPFEVPDGDEVKLTLAAALGDAKDEVTVSVPIRPWGVQAYASASGSSSDDATAFVTLPPGRAYEEPEMLVMISPTTRRMLIEMALGDDAYVASKDFARCVPLPPNTTADRAGDLLAASSAMAYLRSIKGDKAPEASRLTDRVRGLVAELVSLQNEDGGWPWVAGTSGQARPSDRMTSARVVWSLSSALELGLLTDMAVAEKGLVWLAQEFAKVEGNDNETRATILHALSTRGKAPFEQVNALNRVRQNLTNASLAYLAMTLANLDRASLGDEVLNVLAPRGKSEPTVPGGKARRFWTGEGQHPWHRSDAETTALAALAFSRVRPQSPDLAAAIDWLAAHRQGNGWNPAKAKGPAIAAMAKYYGTAEAAEDRYKLVVSVNDHEIYSAEVIGSTSGQAIRVPRRFVVPSDKNAVRFDIEGRGRFGYSVTLSGFTRDFGPDQDASGKGFGIHRRVYWPDNPTVDGRTISQGFGTAVNIQSWENVVSQVPLGGKVPISVEAWREQPAGQPAWERDFLVMKEYLPAGTTFVEGSVNSQASHHTVEDGVLTLYFTPDQQPNVVYEVYGYLPGQYRALPASLSSAYEPGRRHLGKPNDFKVLSPGEKSTDPYRVTPDELYARGKYWFDAGKYDEAAPSLKALWGGYGLRDDVAKDAARMLLAIAIKDDNARDIVVYFEVLKEKDPDRVLSFDDIKAVGRAYGTLGEHERAFLVWRATTEASYLEDARVGEVLRQRGKTLEGVAYLLDLWREYPSTASIQSDFFGLAQLVASLAGRAINDPAIRSELAEAGATRSDLLLQAIRLGQAFLAQSPKDPQADEASLALVGSFLELEDFNAVVKLSRRYAELYPKSTFQDSFQYSEALGRFHLGEYDRAIAVARKIADATYKDANGVDQPSPNKWQAVYILGQIYDARREPAQALSFYEKVADRFSDAAGAVKSLTRKELKLPEVSVIRPGVPEVVDAPAGFRAVPIEAPKVAASSAKLDYRNIASADVKVYPVDLMRLYLTRRNLDAVAGIDLAGIKPFYEATVPLGDGKDFDDKTKALDLPVKKEGAYLVMVRGDDKYASGILLVSPLELQVLEEPESGRVRVTIRDAKTKAYVPKVQVKVIGSNNPSFFSGETDLRGVFVAEGVIGQVTAVARKGTNEYAFHRGSTFVGQPPSTPAANQPGKPAAYDAPADLQQNVRGMNTSNQIRQLQRLDQRFQNQDKGVKVKAAY